MPSDQINLITHVSGLPYSTTKVDHVDLNNNISFKGVTLKHSSGTVGGTNAYVANSVIEWIRVFAHGKCIVDLVGDAVAEAIPYPIQLLREMNKLYNGVAETAEYFNVRFPFAYPLGSNAYIQFKHRAVGDLQTGTVADTLVGSTFDVQLDKQPMTKRVEFLMNCGKIPTTTLTGNLSFFLNPTEVGYKCAFIMLLVEDNATASDSAIAKITLKKGSDIIQEGTIADFRQRELAKSGIATSTGFAKIWVKRAIGSNDLQIVLNKTAAGTAVTVHWLMVSMK